MTLKHLTLENELKIDSSSSKNIHFFIVVQSKHYFKGAIPSSNHISSVCLILKMLWKSKVYQLYFLIKRIYHYVLWLNIPMHNSLGMKILKSRTYLHHYVPDLTFIQTFTVKFSVISIVLTQIHWKILED